MIPRLISSFVFAIVIVFSVNAQNDDASILKTICEGSTVESEIKIWPGSKCQQYATCYKGAARPRQHCPSGLVMDVKTERCRYEKDVQCMDTSDRTLPDCTRKAVQGACNNYTECGGTGNLIMKNCGEGTVYSMSKGCVRETSLNADEKKYCNTRPFV